ncbi:zinc-dependent metalloprotease [Lentzea tibetensis]|uniref:Zinc-dependent metalloprotease n=1 Tax=Lentzea tibetensis TaxID=2591470 RepID=A0A563EUI4_9PSEU|nr:zinc-dependent metalloprotease [Lentzea tibetensis]TWP51387.1 zinc-dependent metalloprotease [Lentzea tibetensis]
MNGATEAELGPVDWELAAATAVRLVRPGPQIPRDEADHVVGRLRELATSAEVHVRDLTGLGQGLPLLPGEVVDRPAWVRAAVQGLEALTAPALPRSASPLAGVLAGTAGVQAGVVLAFLSSRVLGQYDPFSPNEQLAGRLLLVAPNIVGAQQALDVPADDFRMWVCLHECTHRLQFTGVPWLRPYFADQVVSLLSAMDTARAPLGDVIRDFRQKLRAGDGPMGLIELVQTPQQKLVLDRLIALSTLLEGHADHVMDAVGPSVVPSVATIRSRFTARRKGGGLLDRVLRTLLGVEAKVRQYAEGAAFTEYVVDRVGMDGFNAIWTSAETLPTRAEIAEPITWLRRVAP